MSRLSEGSVVATHNKSFSLTAEIEVPKSGANGVIVAMGGVTGGWSFYAKNGKLKHCYNFFGINEFFAEGRQTISEGKHQVRMEFKYDGGGTAKELFTVGELGMMGAIAIGDRGSGGEGRSPIRTTQSRRRAATRTPSTPGPEPARTRRTPTT